jgi:hypothetical protein
MRKSQVERLVIRICEDCEKWSDPIMHFLWDGLFTLTSFLSFFSFLSSSMKLLVISRFMMENVPRRKAKTREVMWTKCQEWAKGKRKRWGRSPKFRHFIMRWGKQSISTLHFASLAASNTPYHSICSAWISLNHKLYSRKSERRDKLCEACLSTVDW